jgi:hypothetical protein
VRRPRQLADCILVSGHDSNGAVVGHADIECTDDAIDAGSSDDRVAVLFQSWVRASEGATPTGAAVPMRALGGVCIGTFIVRWLLALAGVRRSKTRMWLSELTLLSMLGLCGLKAAEYVHEWVGRVVMLAFELGFQILMVPSQLLDKNVSLETKFQWTAKTSRACSCHDWTGNCESVISNSLTEPSPPAVRIWFSCASDHVLSKRESCVSNLFTPC